MPGKAVIVFSFDEPQSPREWANMVGLSKALFTDEDVRVHAAKDDAADYVIEFFETGEEHGGNLVEHARRELALVETDQDFIKSIIAAVRGFSTYGHSGGSHSAGLALLNDLLQFKNLSPLTNNPDEWMQIAEEVAGPNIWQSKRNPEAFSQDGGKTYYLLSEGATQDNPQPIHHTENGKEQ